jgi:hypothetical protein
MAGVRQLKIHALRCGIAVAVFYPDEGNLRHDLPAPRLLRESSQRGLGLRYRVVFLGLIDENGV